MCSLISHTYQFNGHIIIWNWRKDDYKNPLMPNIFEILTKVVSYCKHLLVAKQQQTRTQKSHARRCAEELIQFKISSTWCVFVRAALHMRTAEKPTRCHWMLYWTYDMLNMFWALLCPSSGARDYMCVFTVYGVQCLVAGCRGSVQDSRLWVQEVGCFELLMMGIEVPETCWAYHKYNKAFSDI